MFAKMFVLVFKDVILSTVIQPFFWLVLFFLFVQYKRAEQVQKELFGNALYSVKDQVIDSLLFGIVAGVIGSLVMVYLGIPINGNGFNYVWILAILMMLINPRYICFSYAGGIVSLFSLITGYPDVDVSGVMALVGILHLMESMLIWVDGYKSRLPIFVKRDNNTVVGGFSLQRFWPIPFVILTAVMGPIHGSSIATPDWWPLIKTAGANHNYAILPAVAALGYGDIALTQIPERHTRDSAIRLMIFSIILTALAVLSTKYILLKWAAAIFAPLAHEALIIYGQKTEKYGKPAFAPVTRGVKILDVFPDSPAQTMGLKSGDVILKINNEFVNSDEDIVHILDNFVPFIWMDVKGIDGKIRTAEYADYKNGIDNLGIIFVPQNPMVSFSIDEHYSPIKKILSRFLTKN